LCEGIFKMPQADLRLYTFWVIIATAGLVFCLLPLFFLDFSNNRSNVAFDFTFGNLDNKVCVCACIYTYKCLCTCIYK
jgi:hypothetical protein